MYSCQAPFDQTGACHEERSRYTVPDAEQLESNDAPVLQFDTAMTNLPANPARQRSKWGQNMNYQVLRTVQDELAELNISDL